MNTITLNPCGLNMRRAAERRAKRAQITRDRWLLFALAVALLMVLR